LVVEVYPRREDSVSNSDSDTVTFVAPNGKELVEKYHPNNKVRVALASAVKAFAKDNVLDGTADYVLVLGEAPLDPDITLEEANVGPGARLKIRSKKIPNDGCTRS
jgi:hypothetical protein